MKEYYCTRKSCTNIKCERNSENVVTSQSGVEYEVRPLFNTKECLGFTTEKLYVARSV